MFGNRIDDMLSGYRVFSRRFVKSFPRSRGGFEIETELTVHAMQMRMPIVRGRDALQGPSARLRQQAATPITTVSAS